jgi:hypothetical protein
VKGIEIRQPASEKEAAAIAAAIEHFTADTAPAAPEGREEMDPWLRAALVEGVNARDVFGPGHLDGPETGV